MRRKNLPIVVSIHRYVALEFRVSCVVDGKSEEADDTIKLDVFGDKTGGGEMVNLFPDFSWDVEEG